MDKDSLLNQIKTALKELLSQTEKLGDGGDTLHKIEIDLLLEKTRALYGQIMALEAVSSVEKRPVVEPVQQTSVPVPEEIPEQIVEKEAVADNIPEEENVAVSESQSQPKAEEEDNPVPEEKEAEAKPPEEPVKPPEKFSNVSKTTLDLFSEAPPETLGDSLTHAGKQAVGDSMQVKGIIDIREAIGINDKFLFINELFNGDLERYNKVIDELNGFSGFPGAQTYLTELQVQYQWDEEGAAYQKLNNLLERKFA